MLNTVHVIEHHNWPTDAGQTHLASLGFDVRVHHVWRGEPLPTLTGDEAGVLTMGGPQMVSEHEKWPYLADEFRLIEDALKRDIPLVGVCLGSQIIAHVLGAPVTYADDPKAMSMGFYETRSLDEAFMPTTLMTLNGNSQGWDLPTGATLLATSDQTIHPNQAFAYGDTVLALQFHPEVTPEIFDVWHGEFGHLVGRPGTQTRDEQLAGFERWQAEARTWYRQTLERYLPVQATA
ncbi:MAG: type 1 glutamine amidotransferase [Pseudomonadota bacterium]